MTTYIGLLRAVNLAGRNKVAMSDLRQLLATIGMEDARSLLQSGNVLFRSASRSSVQLERTLAQATKERLGVETDFFVRTAGEWRELVADNPFPREAKSDPGHLVAMCLKEAPDKTAVAALQKAILGREVVRAVGRHAYIVYPDGIGRSRLTMALIEKKLGTRGTGRNWNTVMKLDALAKPA
jgi:uncharacterized protein (DUF1697 family)